MSNEWNWGQDPEKTDGGSRQPENTDDSGKAASDQQTAPEDNLNENVTYHYKYTSSRTADGSRTGNPDNGNYYGTSETSEGKQNTADSGQPSEPKYGHYQVGAEKDAEEKNEIPHKQHKGHRSSSDFGKRLATRSHWQ